MSEFLKAMKDSGIIQRLRAGLSELEKIQFDKAVEKTMKEYNSMWLETQPMISEYQTKVKEHANKSEGEPGHDIESDDRE
ncbi:MAG: hypothetical protein CMM15_06475 [Rhodospirillaceae bacterium]|nr:hypothetical protein [Rhodospirillaceae bacterium]